MKVTLIICGITISAATLFPLPSTKYDTKKTEALHYKMLRLEQVSKDYDSSYCKKQLRVKEGMQRISEICE